MIRVRNKHAKRAVKELKSLGCDIEYVKRLRSLNRHRRCYIIAINFHGEKFIFGDASELYTCKYALKMVKNEILYGTLTKFNAQKRQFEEQAHDRPAD